MHPDIARDLISQRTSEMRAQASRDAMVRAARQAARQAARSRRDGLAAAGEAPLPRVPDYVDGALHDHDALCGVAGRGHADA